jgi:hypothetical protein
LPHLRGHHGPQRQLLPMHELRFYQRLQLGKTVPVTKHGVGLPIRLKFYPIRLKSTLHNVEVLWCVERSPHNLGCSLNKGAHRIIR